MPTCSARSSGGSLTRRAHARSAWSPLPTWGLSTWAICALLFGSVAASPVRAEIVVPPPHAQPEAATAVVLGSVAPEVDPSIPGVAQASLEAVLTERGYTLVTLTQPPAPLELGSPSAITALAAQLGVDRVLNLRVARDGDAYLVHLALGSGAEQPGVASLQRVSPELFAATLTEMARLLLPPAGQAPVGQWIAAPTAAARVQAPSTLPAAVGAGAYDGAQPAPAAAPRARRDRTPLALVIAGAVSLGAGWVSNGLIGALSGYRSCIFSGCTSGFDPAWDAARVASFVPLIGPWVQLALIPNTDNGWPIWLPINGLLQAAGLGMLIAGLVIDGDAPPPVAILPSVGHDHATLTLAGTF